MPTYKCGFSLVPLCLLCSSPGQKAPPFNRFPSQHPWSHPDLPPLPAPSDESLSLPPSLCIPTALLRPNYYNGHPAGHPASCPLCVNPLSSGRPESWEVSLLMPLCSTFLRGSSAQKQILTLKMALEASSLAHGPLTLSGPYFPKHDRLFFAFSQATHLARLAFLTPLFSWQTPTLPSEVS